MATPTTISDYCSLLIRSKLLPVEQIESLQAKWRAQSRGREDQVESFRKFLVSQRALTEYQAALLQRGRADNFFLGGYRILDRIGKGQTSGVYKAAHALGQIVALKILPASSAKKPHILGRFQREARLLIQLDHPNVVRAFQVGEANGVHYIVMEYLEGETLDEVLGRRRRLPVAEAVRLVVQTLNGLQHLHERRMVHRDLKPANLMLNSSTGKSDTTLNATVKILDIGLGRELFDESTPNGQIDTQLTIEGTVLGTPDYLAPEQARDARSADIRADVYSVGCVLYHCLTGQPPFLDTSMMSQMLKHATEIPTSLASLIPDVPAGLQEVLDRFLAKSPPERFATPAEGSIALGRFVVSQGTPAKAAVLVPEYKAWLATESHLELPGNLPAASGGSAIPVKPATQIAKPVRSGPSPAIASHPESKSKPAESRSPRLERPSPSLAVVPDEINVELLLEPLPVLSVHSIPHVSARQEEGTVGERGLLDFDRRDWIMLASGAASVLFAVGVGYGLARLVRKKPEGVPPEQ